MSTRVGDFEVSYSSRGNPTYRLEMWHDDLKKHRVITGNDAKVVQRKAQLQEQDWEEKWAVMLEREARRKERDNKKQYQDERKQTAVERTREALEELNRLEKTLLHTLDVDDTIDWPSLKDISEFPEPPPSRPAPLPAPKAKVPPREPSPNDSPFTAQLSLLDRLVSSRRASKETAARRRYELAHAAWKEDADEVAERNDAAVLAHKKLIEEQNQQYQSSVQKWETRRSQYLQEQEAANAAVDRQHKLYEAGDPGAIVGYCDMVLSNSDYPSWMPQEFKLDYNPETKILVVEYALPSVDVLPTLTEVKYIQSRDEYTEKHLSNAQVARIYDNLIYQIALRTIHELFESDVIGALDAIVFNGCVTSIDRGSGHETTACILSLQAGRSEFLPINLAQVDPKTCFRSLRGVGSSKLHSLTPIAPILQLRREDGRFVSAREVANTLDESMNLAAMDWEDFEHLIRELFEQEFKSDGGEVNVTQASRDGGVDAIAFDPDPIRGGKIVIQAKRYTNTVGVAAVRDLFGTVMNEGANKGILVTTSDYGPDAYAFVKDKPLTLLNGANLLHLLQKHGHKARIDIKEARKLSQ